MARRGIELEVKFAPVGEQTLADLAAQQEFPGWQITGRHDEAQQNTYFDTPDALLEAASCSLRRRILNAGAGGIEWTFKRGRGPGRDGVARRREINALLPARKGDLRGAFPRGKCAPIERARQVAGEQPLQPLFTLLTTRHQIELTRDDGARVALALDHVALEDEPTYRETEVEIELFAGDERAMAELALWLMRTYGVLPMRGSKRGRALAWRRGIGLPVVAPALALDLLAERASATSADTATAAPLIALASPRGSDQARRLATALATRLPAATVVTTAEGSATSALGTGPTIMVGRSLTALPAAASAAWVKVGLPRPLLGRLIDDTIVAGVDPWAVLRRLGEYVEPSQRRYLDPAARDADLIVIDNLPPSGDDQHLTPTEQVKFSGWPADAILHERGAILHSVAREEDHFFRLPAATAGDYLRVRLREDTAWVSYVERAEPERIATHEARPRILPLLRSLGYSETDTLLKIRRRYRLGGWEIALDRVAQLGQYCELRRVAADDRDCAELIALLGLATLARTASPYLRLHHEAVDAFSADPAAATPALA